MQTIYLADDDSDDAYLFISAVRDVNPEINVVVAENGSALLEMMKSASTNFPDVIFLDINMPVMNGKDCLQALKQDPAFRNLPVIIYSTASLKREIESTYKLGAHYYFQKPDDYKDLRDFLNNLCNQNSPDISVRPAPANFFITAGGRKYPFLHLDEEFWKT